MLKEIKTILLLSILISLLFMPHFLPIVASSQTPPIALSKEENQTVTMKPFDVTKRLLQNAQSKIGAPYDYGKSGPDRFDCSGFVYYLFQEQNISLPRTSLAQSQIGKKLTREEIQRGDLLFFDTSGKGVVNHTGIYLGDDTFIHASSGKAKGVTTSSLNHWYKDKFKWGIRQKRSSHE